MKLTSTAALAVAMIAFATAAGAQNSTEPPLVAPPPPTQTDEPASPPASATIPRTPTPAPAQDPPDPALTSPPPPTTTVIPDPMPLPSEPVTISPDVAYPNGFADPADPFGNGMSLAYREEEGFDWGLLGLLGLLGLIPLFRRGDGFARTVYREREEDPARVLRRDRRDEGP
jgi:hypothetical protein